MGKSSFCTFCGGHLIRRHVEGRERSVCFQCAEIAYENPIPAAACIVMDAGKILLVRRSIEPRLGKWCLPGGFNEVDESVRECAIRELEEETGLKGTITGIADVCNQMNATYPNVLLVGFYVDVPKPVGMITVNDDADDYGFFGEDELPEIAFDSHEHYIRLAFEHTRRQGAI